MTNLDHIQSLIRHGAQLRGEDGSLTFFRASTASFGWPSGRTATPTPAAQRVSAPALPAEGHRAAQRGLRASFA